jgi:predicted aspartyl protease
MNDRTQKSNRFWNSGVITTLMLLLNPATQAQQYFPQTLAQASPHIAQTSNQTSNKSLLLEVDQCIQKASAQKTPTPLNTKEIATQCMFSVVMLNPDGTVRPDARERIAELLTATGVKMPQPFSRGQTNIGLTLIPNQPIFAVPVTISGQSFSFVLDTGTGNSVIDRQVAQQLGLKGNALPAQMLGPFVFGQQKADKDIQVYGLPPMRVGRAQVNRLFGVGLSTAILPFKTNGILGLNFLSRFDVILNPQTQRLSLLNASTPIASDIPLKGRFGVMATPSVSINGKGPYTFLMDTGAAMTIISDRLAQELALKMHKTEDVAFGGLGGEEKAKQTQLDLLTIHQTHRIPKLNVLVLNSKLLQTLGVDGVIGQDILNRYVQHWRFGPPSPLGDPKEGSLDLSPISEFRVK